MSLMLPIDGRTLKQNYGNRGSIVCFLIRRRLERTTRVGILGGLLFGGFMLIWPLVVSAAGLREMARLTIENSTELQELQEKRNASELKIKEQWGLFTPSVSLSAARSWSDQKKPVDVERHETEYLFSITQPLYRPGLSLDYRESMLDSEFITNQMIQTRENLLKQLMEHVLDACRILSRREVSRNNVDFMKRTAAVQKRLLDIGYGSRINLIEAETELARYTNTDQTLESQLRLKLLELTLLTGRPVKEDFLRSLRKRLEHSNDRLHAISPAAWFEKTLVLNSQLSRFRTRFKQMTIARQRQYGFFKPRVDVILSYEQGEERALATSRRDEFEVKLDLSLALTPVRTHFQIQRQDIEAHALQIEESKVRKELKNRILFLVQAMDEKRRNTAFLKEWLARQKAVLEILQKGMKEKHFSLTRYLEKARELNESRLEMIETIYAKWGHAIALLHLSGQMTLERISRFASDLSKPAVTE